MGEWADLWAEQNSADKRNEDIHTHVLKYLSAIITSVKEKLRHNSRTTTKPHFTYYIRVHS